MQHTTPGHSGIKIPKLRPGEKALAGTTKIKRTR